MKPVRVIEGSKRSNCDASRRSIEMSSMMAEYPR